MSESQRLTREVLERHLWAAVEILHGSAPSSDYKNYILGLLLLKRLSDRFEEESEIVRLAGGEAEDRDEHQFFVPPRSRWSHLQKVVTGIGEELNRAAAALEHANPALEGVLASIDFNDTWRLGDVRQRESLLSQLVQLFSQLGLRNDNLSDPDLLGHAYEYLIQRFVEDTGGRGGEFYTPHQVGRLMVEILQPREGMRICDPTCGSGGMLIQCAEYVERHGGNRQNLSLNGQERNRDTWSLCKMNLLLHGLPDARIEIGDTIRNPKLSEQGKPMSFDRVLSNPPAALSNWGREVAERELWRFPFGVPPASRGDYAFLQHMISILNPRGRMAILMPQVALAREGPELQIRKKLVESDLIEAVVGLPSGTLHATKVAPAIVVVSRAKSLKARGRVLFVDASRQLAAWFPTEQFQAQAQDRKRIANAVQEFSQEKEFSKAVPLKEIVDQNFNLQPSLYHREPASGEKLNHIAEIYQGKGQGRDRATRSESLKKIAVLQGRDLGVRRLSIDDLARWPAPRDPSRMVTAREGDILLQRIGKSPKSMVVGKDLAGALVSDTAYVIRLREEDRPKAAYLVGFLNSAAGQKRLTPSQEAAVIPTLTLRTLRSLRIPLPNAGALELFDRVRNVEDDLLDRVQKALEIRSKLFDAGDSEALETELRRLSVDAELLKESLVHAEDIDFQIRNFYPHVIADGYRRLQSALDDHKLYLEQFRFLETLLTFLGSLGLAIATSIVDRGLLEVHQLGRQKLEKLWGSNGPTMGQWLSVCRDTAKLLRNKPTSSAGGAFATMWSPQLEHTFGRLVDMRNAEAHGRGPTAKKQFQAALAEFDHLLKESLKECLFLFRYPIRLVVSISVSWGDTGAMHKTLVYRGEHSSLQREDLWYGSALPQGYLYMESDSATWLPLYPFLSVEEADNERCTYAIERFNYQRSQVTLKGLGQSQEPSADHTTDVAKDLRTWLDQIFGPNQADPADSKE